VHDWSRYSSSDTPDPCQLLVLSRLLTDQSIFISSKLTPLSSLSQLLVSLKPDLFPKNGLAPQLVKMVTFQCLSSRIVHARRPIILINLLTTYPNTCAKRWSKTIFISFCCYLMISDIPHVQACL
jgi:hypothetical protein